VFFSPPLHPHDYVLAREIFYLGIVFKRKTALGALADSFLSF